jgi:hypothetical protein
MRRCIKIQLTLLTAKQSANMIDTHIGFLKADSGLRGLQHINDLIFPLKVLREVVPNMVFPHFSTSLCLGQVLNQ